MRARSGSGSRLCLSLAGWPSLARALLCLKAMADAATFVVDYEDCGRKNARGERAHTSSVMFFFSLSTGKFESI